MIDDINADGTFLEIQPKKAGKEPLQFDIAKLRLHSVGKDRPMEFEATLTNPKPPGLIQSTGHFGPWQSGEPGESAVDGHYTFTNADLGVFKGISGILSSTGDYRGKLNKIEVSGTTDTPDFTVTTGGHPVHLTTDFHAIVDGTDGDTYLQPVNAKFGGTTLECRGRVEHEPGKPGKVIELDVKMDKGRIEDLLRLAVKGDALMVGAATLQTKFLLPPGPRDVMSKLQLDGVFGIGEARFTKGSLQEKITDLSLRGQGRAREAQQTNVGPEATTPADVASNLKAGFTLKDGAATFRTLSFAVPGAQLALSGDYNLVAEQLDFRGTFRMEARVSQAFTGWKSMLLKAADPFFKKNGAGAEIPLRITGTREKPAIGLELFRRQQ